MPDHASRRCPKCGEVKSLEQFPSNRTKPLGHDYTCRECIKASDRQYYWANRQSYLERQRARQAANREVLRAAGRRWRQANREHAVSHLRNYRAEVRALVFGHYGMACACCGTTESLTIDHINGDGEQHRLELFGESQGRGGSQFYAWLVRQGFPPGYQTLCRPCNASKDKGRCCRIDH